MLLSGYVPPNTKQVISGTKRLTEESHHSANTDDRDTYRNTVFPSSSAAETERITCMYELLR